MRASELFFPTLRETPSEAEIASHRLMLKAGMMRKVASGVYCYLPLGQKVLKKVIKVIREEMDAAGAQEISLPALQPSEIWEKSGRWFQYGPEMMRLKDRRERDFCLGPTHEELITDLVNSDVLSYKQLPLTLYQIQPKFRDEIRPRFGTMRLREFLMKDAYSFDASWEGLNESFEKMAKAYGGILDRLGLEYKMVAAQSGLIGGDVSKEFMVLADAGEDEIVHCKECDYAANIEVAESRTAKWHQGEVEPAEMEKVSTPGVKSAEELSKFLDVPLQRILKTLLYRTPDGLVAVLMRGDHQLNENKMKQLLGVEKAFLLDPEEGRGRGLAPGFLGPVGLPADIELVADEETRVMKSFATGANEEDAHFMNVELERDFRVSKFADLREVKTGDRCPKCGDELLKSRGIEMGHIFQLGTKYSESMNATFLNEKGQPSHFVMGCYGIGVDRLIAAYIEQHFDEKGIIWSRIIAPFELEILLINTANDEQGKIARELYSSMSSTGMDVLIDDRNVSAGVKFSDAELIGVPFRVNVGNRAEREGVLELVQRSSGEKTDIDLSKGLKEAVSEIGELILRD